MLLTDQLLLDSVEQAAKLAGALTLIPFGEPRTKVQHEEPWEAIGERNLEKCMTRSWWMTPLVFENVNVAQESGRV
jgi:hypothetical protein